MQATNRTSLDCGSHFGGPTVQPWKTTSPNGSLKGARSFGTPAARGKGTVQLQAMELEGSQPKQQETARKSSQRPKKTGAPNNHQIETEKPPKRNQQEIKRIPKVSEPPTRKRGDPFRADLALPYIVYLQVGRRGSKHPGVGH